MRKAILIVAVVVCCFTSTETVGLLRTGDQDGHLDFLTAPGLSNLIGFCCCFYGVLLALYTTELRSCVKVEVAILGSLP